MSFTFQQATSKDSEAIAQLHTKSWRNSYKGILSDDYLDNHALQDRQAIWQKRFEVENPNQCVVLAKEGESLAGFVCLFANYHEQFGAYLDNLHVHPAYQSKGLGKKLMQQAVTWLLEQGNNKTMYLWVFEANQDACRFYESLEGINHEVSLELMPDGNKVLSRRYIWNDISKLGI